MRTLIPAAARAYTKPNATWWPTVFVVLAVIPAIVGWNVLCALLLAASCITSVWTRRMLNPLRELLMLGGFFDVAVQALRLAVLLILGTHIWTSPGIAVAIGCAGIALVFMSVLTNITVDRLATRLIPEISTRNLSIAPPRPPLPAKLLADGLALLLPELILIAGGAIITASVLLASLVAIVAVVALAVGTLATDWLLRTKGNAFRKRVLADVQRALAEFHPEVAIYLGTSQADSVYQIDGWLTTAEEIPQQTVIIVRAVSMLEHIGATDLPIVALPTAQDLLYLDLTTLRACLYVANTGDVIHLIREQNPMSAFIGHGDSDKNSSFNPFTKVYDEVWVAGAAGERRYARARIGLRSDQFVSVGRPQLDVIDLSVVGGSGATSVPTVLYAPTWEGWNSEQEYCSLLGQGVRVVEQLLNHDQPLRLIYKPHPFTGIRAPAARAASNRIIAMIGSANSRNGFTNSPPTPQKAAQAKSATEASQLATAAGNAFFERLDEREHLVVSPDSGLGIFQCFEHSNALIADVSSVLSDFIGTGRPYAVCNSQKSSESEFIDQFPSARGGVVIDQEANNARDFFDVVSGARPDTLREVRAEVREYLLGPTTPTASERFNIAVTNLVERANDRVAQRG